MHGTNHTPGRAAAAAMSMLSLGFGLWGCADTMTSPAVDQAPKSAQSLRIAPNGWGRCTMTRSIMCWAI